MERHRRWIVLLVSVLVALSASGPAMAKCRKAHLPKGNPAVKEYQEQVPTVCGPKVPGTGDEQTTKLPTSVEKKLTGSSDAGPLKDLATNARQGAPQPARGKEPARILSQRERNPVGASLNAATSGHDATLIALLAVMGALALGAALTAVYRRRKLGR